MSILSSPILPASTSPRHSNPNLSSTSLPLPSPPSRTILTLTVPILHASSTNNFTALVAYPFSVSPSAPSASQYPASTPGWSSLRRSPHDPTTASSSLSSLRTVMAYSQLCPSSHRFAISWVSATASSSVNGGERRTQAVHAARRLREALVMRMRAEASETRQRRSVTVPSVARERGGGRRGGAGGQMARSLAALEGGPEEDYEHESALGEELLGVELDSVNDV
ncbi:hypothetical protein MY10362_000440 [Beauveria mimosiformis]